MQNISITGNPVPEEQLSSKIQKARRISNRLSAAIYSKKRTRRESDLHCKTRHDSKEEKLKYKPGLEKYFHLLNLAVQLAKIIYEIWDLAFGGAVNLSSKALGELSSSLVQIAEPLKRFGLGRLVPRLEIA